MLAEHKQCIARKYPEFSIAASPRIKVNRLSPERDVAKFLLLAQAVFSLFRIRMSEVGLERL